MQGGVGVRVHSMHAEGLAHASGVRPADVLLSIDGVRCTSPEAAAEMLRSKGAGAIRLELWREGAGSPAAAGGPAAAASPAPASCLTPRAAAPAGADPSTLSKGVDMLGGNMAELSDTLKRRGGPRGSVSFAVPVPAVVNSESKTVADDAALEPNYSVNYSAADARDEPVDEQAAAREAKLRSFAEFCKRDEEEAAEASAAEARPRAVTSGVAEDMEAWLGAAAESEGEGTAVAAEGEGKAAEAEGAAVADAEADAEGGVAAEAEAEVGSDASPELIRINQGWQVRGVGTKVDSKTAVAASADDQGTKARATPLARLASH